MSARGTQWWIVVWVLGILLAFGGRPCAAQTYDTFLNDIAITKSSPTLLLSSANKGWFLKGGDDFTIRGGATDNAFIIKDGAPSWSLAIGDDGNVGIGTIGGEASLHILRDSNPSISFEQTGGAANRHQLEVDTLGRFALRTFATGGGFSELPFVVEQNAPTFQLYLDNSGRIGMGIPSPDTNSQLDIRSNLLNGVLMKREDAGSHYMRVENNAGAAFRCGVQADGHTQFGALTPGKNLVLLAGGTSKVAINAAGQLNFGNPPPAFTTDALRHQTGARLTSGGTWTNASSRAVKQDIEPLTSDEARETVRALQPVGYRYKNELDERYVGFIAEDVPELVATRDRKGLAPMDITAVLTKVVQDQDQQLEKERDRNNRLEATVDRQQELIDSLSKRLAALEQKSERAE